MDSTELKNSESADISEIVIVDDETKVTLNSPLKIPKEAIRTSLRASTIDVVFANIFAIPTSGILLSNFVVELGASPIAFGMLSSIPMLVNLVQPLGAYFSEKTTSRFRYSLLIFGTARSLWVILAIAIFLANWGLINSYDLVNITLVIVLVTRLLEGFGGASWLSWLAIIVPHRLRGRYFGFRNSVGSLTNLICVPLAGIAVSAWHGGTLQGFGIAMVVGIISGYISLGCQYFKYDINPQHHNWAPEHGNKEAVTSTAEPSSILEIFKDFNFLKFLFYFGLSMFAINLSLPFFNLYMLDTLSLDVSWVTIYASIQAAVNLLFFVIWGRLADRFGNRLILAFVGIILVIIPFLWLGVGTSNLDFWLWLPMIHILTGGTSAASDLCNNNLQLGVAPIRNQANYFAISAAVAGASGALGTTIGGFIVQNGYFGGLSGLFVISSLFRLVALIPLVFINEPRRKSFIELIQGFQHRLKTLNQN
ncbi:Major facilitator superfamily MFS_1 [Calothrix sp. PCC 7716]|nr:Major facilitator superfamily MFS_1 [Calothrix sp. PCC 7716]